MDIRGPGCGRPGGHEYSLTYDDLFHVYPWGGRVFFLWVFMWVMDIHEAIGCWV